MSESIAGDHRYLLNIPVLRTYPYVYDVLSIRVFNNGGNVKNNAQLYVRYENGTYQAMDKVATTASGDEIFSIMKPAAGNYHILIKGKNTDTVSLTAFFGNYK